jgi:hypothetical protein
MFHKVPSIIIATAAFAALTATACAQATRHRHHPRVVAEQYNDERPPLTVNKRSFLDPGPVGPIYSTPNYVAASTTFAQTPDQYFLKSQFGNEVRPSPLEVPGRPQPIFEFETPAYPY